MLLSEQPDGWREVSAMYHVSAEMAPYLIFVGAKRTRH
jgi:hypothetical protein